MRRGDRRHDCSRRRLLALSGAKPSERGRPARAAARVGLPLFLAVCAACGGGESGARGWLIDATAAVGLDGLASRSFSRAYHMADSMGGGCALFDFDGDGDLDLYLVRGGSGGAGAANLLLSQGAGGRFAPVPGGAGTADEGCGMGVAVGDLDNDGDLDLYLTNLGPDRLFRNDGDGRFEEISEAAGVATAGWGASAGFFDYDGDGLLDLFVTRYLEYDHEAARRGSDGLTDFPGPQRFAGLADVLYRNQGDGTFRDVSAETGIAGRVGKGLGLALGDLDGDGRPDVYVANDGEANFAWMQVVAGRFEERALALGLALNALGRAEAGMGVAAGDLDGDGHEELLVTHLTGETNTLYRRGSAGAFADVTRGSGLGASSSDRTGFGADFLDLELDGDLDLVVADGRIQRGLTPAGASGEWAPYAEPDLVYLNDGSGRFQVAGDVMIGVAGVGRALATGDVDGDGDVDLVETFADGSVRFLRNEAPRRGRLLALRPWDPELGREVPGAVVMVESAGRLQVRTLTRCRGYLASGDGVVYFGLTAAIDSLRVRWPDGQSESFDPPLTAEPRVLVKGTGS
ncbi:MAG: hypothetical protein CMJ84_07740 [Planctomycetes bacterium]|nr:hypothetical protein [Planctomycetota bacterium]